MRTLVRCLKGKPSLSYLVFLVVLVFYTEIYSYFYNRRTWIDLKCETQRLCTRIMLIADPQLIGYKNEMYGVTPFSVFDSDRYLANTFNHAFNFIQPDVIIFLGDLFDEGSTATDEEFKQYGRRLFNIFLHGKSAELQHIWLPGDNDIGGEGPDRITSNKLKRFNAMFKQPDTVHYKNITFYKINRLLQTIPKLPQTVEFYDTTKIVVGLSHVPLMFIPSPFVDKVLTRMQPHLLFTAHEHVSMIVSTNAVTRDARQIIPITPKTTKSHSVALGDSEMIEIIVPTCSYRMGTDKIGFGYAIIENSDLHYTVLWSPSRFPQLYIYSFAVLGLLLILCFSLFKRMCIRR